MASGIGDFSVRMAAAAALATQFARKAIGSSRNRNFAWVPSANFSEPGGRLRTVLLQLLLLICFAGCVTPPPTRPAAIELVFAEFFALPVGPRGLEPTGRLLGLDGKRVAVDGYIVKEDEPFPGLFMLAPLPVSVAERADGPADYLPPATLFVHLPAADRDAFLPWRPGVWRATGTLQLGPREETSGRISYVRLVLEDLSSAAAPQANQESLKE